jgi:hypothetical protein
MMKALLYLLLLPVRILDTLWHFLQLGGVEILAVRTDSKSPQLVHIWYARALTGSRYGPSPAADVRMFGHVALHTGTWKLTAGESQRGTGLDLDSPFAERSLAKVGRRLGLPVALGPKPKSPKNCPIRVTEAKPTDQALPDGPELLVNKWEFDGGADSVSGEASVVRFVQGAKIRWQLRGQSMWLGKERLYAGPNDTAWILYDGVDLRIRAWRLTDGEVLADRFVIGGLL